MPILFTTSEVNSKKNRRTMKRSFMAMLAAWLSAKSQGGHMFLRLEDLDIARMPKDASARVIEDLKWAGLDWVGEPTYQHERTAIYQEALESLESLQDDGGDYMAKTANLYTRIDPELKEQAEHILNSLGLPPSSAITMFYKQVVLQQGLPFDVKLGYREPRDVSSMTQSELNDELEKGYKSVLSGDVNSASKVF